MNIIKYCSKHIYFISCFIAILIIGIICMWNISEQNRITVIDDQFGYWGIAASLAGYDWSDLMGVTGYYSYGYSFILVPLYWLGWLGAGAATMYKISVVFNCSFMIGSFLLTVYLGKRLFPELNRYYLIIISLVATLCLSNVGNAGMAWPEVYLYFLFWCVTVCVYRFLEIPDIKNGFLLLLATAYIFTVHMRAIGVVIAVLLLIFIYSIFNHKNNHKKISLKQAVIIFVAAIVLYVLVIGFKEFVTTGFFQNNASLSMNDFAGQKYKIRNVFSLTGLVDFAMSVLGKLYYLGVSFYLFGFIGVAFLLKGLITNIFYMIKAKRIAATARDYFSLFLLMAFLGEVAVAAIFKIFNYYSLGHTFTYADTIVHGRYTEFMMGPLLLTGFALLPEIKRHMKELLFSITVLIVCAISVQHQINILLTYNDPGVIWLRSTAAQGLVHLVPSIQTFPFFPLGVSMLVTATIVFTVLLSKKTLAAILLSIVSLAVIGSTWAAIGVERLEETVRGKSNKVKHVESIVELIENLEEETDLYYITDGIFHVDIKILQWICYDKSIRLLTPAELGLINDEREYLLISNSDDLRLTGLLYDSYSYLYDSGTLNVFAQAGSETEADALQVMGKIHSIVNPKEEAVELSDMLTELSYQKYNGNIYFNYNRDEGYLTERTHLVLGDGLYEFTVAMEISEHNGIDNIGYITVTNTADSYLDTRVLTPEDFKGNGKGLITVQLEVKNYEEPVIGVYTYTNCAMKITDVRYRQIKGNAMVGASDIDGLRNLDGILTEFIAAESSDQENPEKENSVKENYIKENIEIVYIDSDSSGTSGFPDMTMLENCFEGRSFTYLPGNIISFMEQPAGKYLLAEKTADDALRLIFYSEYRVLGESDEYYLLTVE